MQSCAASVQGLIFMDTTLDCILRNAGRIQRSKWLMSFLWILWSRIGVMSYKERLGYVTTVIRYHFIIQNLTISHSPSNVCMGKLNRPKCTCIRFFPHSFPYQAKQFLQLKHPAFQASFLIGLSIYGILLVSL